MIAEMNARGLAHRAPRITFLWTLLVIRQIPALPCPMKQLLRLHHGSAFPRCERLRDREVNHGQSPPWRYRAPVRRMKSSASEPRADLADRLGPFEVGQLLHH